VPALRRGDGREEVIVLFVIGYFAIGTALFFAFWRWIALEGDEAGNNFTSLALLFIWPAAIATIGICLLICFLLDCGKKVMK